MPKRRLKDLRFLVTGASSGIGFEIARQLLQRNCRLIVTARRLQNLERLLQFAISEDQIHMVAGDITDAAHRSVLMEKSVEHFDGLDGLINNAGVSGLGRFEDSSPDVLRRVMEVNFFSPVELIRIALPILRKGTKPLLVNISSVLGHRAVPEKSEYCASKFVLHGFSDALRAELGNDVSLLLVSPSTTKSDLFDNAVENNSHREWKSENAMTAEAVARKTLQAMTTDKHEIILTLGAKGLVLMDRLAPTLTNKVIQRFG